MESITYMAGKPEPAGAPDAPVVVEHPDPEALPGSDEPSASSRTAASAGARRYLRAEPDATADQIVNDLAALLGFDTSE